MHLLAILSMLRFLGIVLNITRVCHSCFCGKKDNFIPFNHRTVLFWRCL